MHLWHRRFPLAAALMIALAAGCAAPQPAHSPVSAAALRELAARYLAIAKAGNRHLERDFDRLDRQDRNNLAAAQADLRDAAAAEHLFDQRLLAIAFPPQIEAVARLLVYLNESRSQLTRSAAGSRTLRQLHAYEIVLRAANVPVEREVSVIRKQLGLPPPEAS